MCNVTEMQVVLLHCSCLDLLSKSGKTWLCVLHLPNLCKLNWESGEQSETPGTLWQLSLCLQALKLRKQTHSGNLQRHSQSQAESSRDLDCSLVPAKSSSGCVWWLRTGSRRRPVSGHLWVCVHSAPVLKWRQSKHTSLAKVYIAAGYKTHVWSWPIRSGSGMESGSCAATSCFKVATLYPPGGTSPGIISGKVKVDLGWSTSFKDSCQSVADISTLWIKGRIRSTRRQSA